MKRVMLIIRYASPMMPPTRGHDLKLPLRKNGWPLALMPPTRGHDLKLAPCQAEGEYEWMPPTRGHDLKPRPAAHIVLLQGCPPHGGTT